MPRLRRLSGLCSSNVSDPANRLRKTRKKKSSAVLLFEAVAGLWSAPDYPRERQEFKAEGHSFNPRTARKQGLAAYGQTAGVPSFLPLRRAPHVPAPRRAQLPLNRRRRPRFNIDFTRKHTLYLNLTNSRFCILQNFRKIIL